MKTQSTTITVLDYCKGLESKEYKINPDYQRNDTVWPQVAQSYLIDTILLDFPIPKMSLYQNLDLLSKKVVKEIVDGQQRSQAILGFYQNSLRLSKSIVTDDYAGLTFEELDPKDQEQFLNYGLNFDLFVAASQEEVREVFRRMNSFTVPLNPEEARHATYQGPFKWFIHRLSREYDEALIRAGALSEKQVNRMADAKLLTEIASALLYGIATTSKPKLDKVYSDNDDVFEREEEIESAMRYGLDTVLGNGALWKTALMKPYNLYSLCLAYIQASGRMTVVDDPDLPEVREFRLGEPVFNLTFLAGVVTDAESYESGRLKIPLRQFVSATRDKTNVAAQRLRRFEYFLTALEA